MDKRIIVFAEAQKAATICCVDSMNHPYCFNCYFYFDDEKGLLYFKTSPESFHSKILSYNPQIAGTILPDKSNVLAVKGIQFSGIVVTGNDELAADAEKKYHNKYPLALAIPGKVFTVKLMKIKMTDSSNVFGKKLEWNRQEPALN